MNDLTPSNLSEFVALRQDLHRHPELGLDEHRTSDIVARTLARLGYKVTRGIGQTGLVGTLSRGTSPRSIGLRADMDALPIHEETGLPHASTRPGLMHACGHDGHTATLLAAAARIAEADFDGTVHLIFQPAEENFGGGRLMVADGLFTRFPCDAVFAFHNEPMLPFGQIALRDGPIMAAVDEALITVRGRGGHGAHPEQTLDPIVAGAAIVTALQTVVSRNIDPQDPTVVTVGAFHAGSASNIIPETAEILLGIRSFDPSVRDDLERRIRRIAEGQAASFGQVAEVDYRRDYPPTVNDPAETAHLRRVFSAHAGAGAVVDLARPFMGSEDFSYMLDEVPGSYFFVGARTSDADRPVHHPGYDFNDDLIPLVSGLWCALVEDRLAPA